MRSETVVLLTENVIRATLLATVLVTPLLFHEKTFELFEYPKIMFVYTAATIIGTAWMIRMLEARTICYRRTPFDIAIGLFFLSNVIATIFSIDPHTSIYGFYSRFNAGLLSLTAYLVLFGATVTFATPVFAKRLLGAVVVSAALVTAWGIPSHFGYDPTCFVFQHKITSSCWSPNFNPTLRLFSTLGQPNWLASFLVFTIPLAGAFTILSFGKRRILLALATLSMLLSMLLALYWTNSRGGLLGLTIAAVIMLAAWLTRHISRTQKLVLGSSTVLLTAISLFTLRTLILDRLDTITIRKSVWEGGIAVWRAHPLTGSGLETFAYSFDRFRPLSHLATLEWDFLYNKAHNELINILATTGLFGLGTYLLMLATFSIMLWRASTTKDTRIGVVSIAVLAGMAGYITSIFFGFSVVATYLLFFILPASVYAWAYPNSSVPRSVRKRSFFIRLGQIGSIGIALFFIYSLTRMYYGDLAFAAGRDAMNTGYYGQAFKSLTEAVTRVPNEPTYLDDFAFTAAVVAPHYEGEEQKQIVGLSDAAIRKALQISPAHVGLWKTSEQVYTQLATLDKYFSPHATAAARMVVALAPNDIRAKHTLATRLLQEGSPEARTEAYTLLQDAVTRKPDFAEGWYSLALLEFEQGATPSAVRAMERVLVRIPNHPQAQEYLKAWSTPSAR